MTLNSHAHSFLALTLSLIVFLELVTPSKIVGNDQNSLLRALFCWKALQLFILLLTIHTFLALNEKK